MISSKLYQGYDEKFILSHTVPLPKLNPKQVSDLVRDEDGSTVIKYINYSLQQSASHRFPFFTASNIDGKAFKKTPRQGTWRKDPRLSKSSQWGSELYAAHRSNFDKGHMTRREDVQWGPSVAVALSAAKSTFYYTNAVPQHRDLNQDLWKSLEDYILHSEAALHGYRICVFTGPVLSTSNPYFVTPVAGETVQIPSLFWKVVVFQKGDGKLYRVGFMMSQHQLLAENHLIEELEVEGLQFMQFADAETYQVNIRLIEQYSGITMPRATDAYTDTRSTKLVLKEIDIDPTLESDLTELGFTIEHLQL